MLLINGKIVKHRKSPTFNSDFGRPGQRPGQNNGALSKPIILNSLINLLSKLIVPLEAIDWANLLFVS